MKKRDIPVKCLNCGKRFESVDEFGEHNKKCGSHGYAVLVGAVKNIQPKKMDGSPKDVSNEAVKAGKTETKKRVIDTTEKAEKPAAKKRAK